MQFFQVQLRVDRRSTHFLHLRVLHTSLSLAFKHVSDGPGRVLFLLLLSPPLMWGRNYRSTVWPVVEVALDLAPEPAVPATSPPRGGGGGEPVVPLLLLVQLLVL